MLCPKHENNHLEALEKMMPNSFKFNGISELLHIEMWAIYVVKLEKTSDYDDEAPGY